MFLIKILSVLSLLSPAGPDSSSVRIDSVDTHVYVGLAWENDGFQARQRNTTDRYYTNGLRIDLHANYWQRWPTRHVLLRFSARSGRSYRSLYGFRLGHEMYTPRNVNVETPRLYPYDRPYAGYVYGAWNLTTVDSAGGRRLTTSLSVGLIGPISGAAPLQEGLHQYLGHRMPRGWRHQLSNDLALSYSAQYEGRLFPRIHPAFDAAGRVDATIGTLMNVVGVGGTVWVGRFNDPFSRPVPLYNRRRPAGRAFQAYGYFRPVLRAVLDNSLLQGGWFSGRRDFYALPAVELMHFYAQLEYGWVFAYQGVQLTLAQTLRTREFRTALPHQWGHFGLLWRL